VECHFIFFFTARKRKSRVAIEKKKKMFIVQKNTSGKTPSPVHSHTLLSLFIQFLVETEAPGQLHALLCHPDSKLFVYSCNQKSHKCLCGAHGEQAEKART